MKQNSLLPFSKILVPYDGSKLSQKALEFAIPIAKMSRESEIILLNVIEKILAPPALFTSRFVPIKQVGKQCYQHTLMTYKKI